MRPGPQHAQPQTEALSSLRTGATTGRTTAFRAPGPRNKPERALSPEDPGGRPGPRDETGKDEKEKECSA